MKLRRGLRLRLGLGLGLGLRGGRGGGGGMVHILSQRSPLWMWMRGAVEEGS